MPDTLETLLRRAPVNNTMRGDLWDAFEASPDPDTLAAKIAPMSVPTHIKAALWDLKAGGSPAPAPAPAAEPRGIVDRAASTLPMVGGMIGGFAGGAPGAALGGAAGQGFKQAIQSAGEIPGAVADVARNMITQPGATLRGFTEGATQGAKGAAVEGGIQGAMEAAGGMAMRGLSNAGRAVYRGYLKPSLAGHSINDAQRIVDTALREGLPISQFGKEKAETLIGQLKGQVDNLLSARQPASQQAHGDIDLHDIANKVRQFARDKYYKPGRQVADYEAALRVADNIDAHPSLNLPPGSAPGPQPRDLTAANVVKRDLQQSAGDRAFGLERSAGTEAEKHGAYQLRQAIEQRVPEVGRLNARESQLIDAAKAIHRAIEREANQNMLVGVKSLVSGGVAGGTTYGATGDPWMAAGSALAMRAALAPEVATRVAIAASRLGRATPQMAPAAAARVALAALAASEE